MASKKTSSKNQDTATESPAKKRAKKTKAKNIFLKDKDIINQKKLLQSLYETRDEIELKVKDIHEEFSESSLKEEDAEGFFDKLPLNSLMEVQKYEAGEKILNASQLLKKRASLRKESLVELKKLEKLDESIYHAQIDLLLAKINCLNKMVEEKTHEI